jgi:hypothetical protein
VSIEQSVYLQTVASELALLKTWSSVLV